MQNRQLIFSPKIQYELAAERSEAASNSLRFSKITPPNETLSELRKRSDFAGAKIALSIFSKPFPPTAEAVNSQSSPQLKS